MAKKEVKPSVKADPQKTAVKKSSPKAKKMRPTDDEIKARAYEIYIESGYQGTEIENWLKAEKELTKGK
jgi:hypothetical protein